MKMAIIYTSVTGNTEQLVHIIALFFKTNNQAIDIYTVHDFPIQQLSTYDLVIVGTYSWGNGDLPKEMEGLYEAFEMQNVDHLITGVFGTGDRFYPHFCGAVDEFRDMLYAHTNLAVTLKVELMPQSSDLSKCEKFYKSLMKRVQKAKVN
ncbi:flavodoxin domain-containing protein [Aquibacillus sediminis]|uniref:flavodoxin domain-containing protein n=1 Tax=Aquibacillus sediminis TaxID=2574734 RepID=UPI001108B76C|nr:flavodoxin domain-containing protein [Aquibacillus sediminis]